MLKTSLGYYSLGYYSLGYYSLGYYSLGYYSLGYYLVILPLLVIATCNHSSKLKAASNSSRTNAVSIRGPLPALLVFAVLEPLFAVLKTTCAPGIGHLP